MLEDGNADAVADSQVKKVVFCSGQVYYDIEAERLKRGINDIAIVRVEQIAPFPFRSVEEQLNRYTNAKVEWLQEEPKNQGMWSFMEPRFRNLLGKLNRDIGITSSGRKISPSTATGYTKQHVAEL